MTELARTDKGVFASFVDRIKRLLYRLSGGKLFSESELYKNVDPKLNAELYKIQRLFQNANKAATGQSVNGDGTRYSISFTTDNRPVVVVNDDIIANAVNGKDLIQTVKRYLGRFKTVPIHGQSIKFLKDTKNEYTRSKYTLYLKNNDPVKYADKMRVAGHPQDMVYATTDYVNEAPKHSRKDGIVDFARGKILFDVSGCQYEADVVIGFTNTGVCELHDIVGMQNTSFSYKEKEAVSIPVDRSNRSSRSDTTPLDPTVPQTDTESQDDSMQNLQKSFLDVSDNQSSDSSAKLRDLIPKRAGVDRACADGQRGICVVCRSHQASAVPFKRRQAVFGIGAVQGR